MGLSGKRESVWSPFSLWVVDKQSVRTKGEEGKA